MKQCVIGSPVNNRALHVAISKSMAAGASGRPRTLWSLMKLCVAVTTFPMNVQMVFVVGIVVALTMVWYGCGAGHNLLTKHCILLETLIDFSLCEL